MKERLEELIDKHGFTPVLEALQAVCLEKASHVRANWQDPRLARTWEERARDIELALWAIERGRGT